MPDQTADTGAAGQIYSRRVYPLDAHNLSEEQIAVAFAMTSRRPEAFDEIAEQVSKEKAADFHERWVLGYGHASVAEHAVVHLAVENVSRLAVDTLEDNRLASYTEKSSRYQVMPEDYFYIPEELAKYPALKKEYEAACQGLFEGYFKLIDGCMDHLRETTPRIATERDGAFNGRLSRIATDHCRAVLPAATLTNVGVTANARVLEHAIAKLVSSELTEEQHLGDAVREQGRLITPTLIKYADKVDYLAGASGLQLDQARRLGFPDEEPAADGSVSGASAPEVRLVHWDRKGEEKLAAALLYRHSNLSYDEVWERVKDLGPESRQAIIEESAAGLGPHDAPLREFEVVDYSFEFILDYGAYREFKRHRMMSYLPQPLTVAHGYRIPPVVAQAGLESEFEQTVRPAEEVYWKVREASPLAAQYLVTHAHNRRVVSKFNLRECYHLFKMRTSDEAHFSIREPMVEAMRLAVEVQPQFFRHLKLRNYPDWWPHPVEG
ncbi:MAG: FAD-dependent thymidylate synthase [Dehalococcoidia bacterium]|nr:FAD-dependent thymidylate synthase [Dehalococcoidia bacterium]